MKNKLWILTRTLIRNGEGFGIKDNKRVKRISLMLVLAVSFASLGFSLIFMIANMLDTFKAIGQEGFVLSWGLVLITLTVFIFGIFYIISSFYFATDIENLIYLPLRPRQIVGAKFLVVMFYEYLVVAFIFLPLLLIYGIKMGSGVMFYIYGSIIFLCLPVIPLALSSVIVMLIMRFTNLRRHRDIFSIVGGVLAIFFGLGINVGIQKFAVNMTPGEMQELIRQGQNSLAVLSTGIFPTVGWAVKALLQSDNIQGFLNLGLHAIVSALAFAVLLYLGELIYFKGLIGISESGAKRRKLVVSDIEKTAVWGNAVWTYAITELKILCRTPVYFLNCVLISFIWPVFFLYPVLAQSVDASFIYQIEAFLLNPDAWGVALCGAFALSLFLGGTNTVTATAISREGQDLYVKKYLPISYKDQIKAKIYSGLILGYISIFMMVLSAIFVLRLPLLMTVLILATSWLGIRFTAYTGILLDLYNPKLKWNSEQQAVKQNMNVVFNMLIGMGLAAATMAVAIKLSISLWMAFAALYVVFGGLNILISKLVYTKGPDRLMELEG